MVPPGWFRLNIALEFPWWRTSLTEMANMSPIAIATVVDVVGAE
jgi:hypothetical protein